MGTKKDAACDDAAKAGSHPTTINLIEKGTILPDAQLVKKVLRSLDQQLPKGSPLAVMILSEAHRQSGLVRRDKIPTKGENR